MATLTLKKSAKLLILLGSLCVSPLSFSEALVATSVQSGEATAAALTRNYYDTAVNCGAATAPAFLCTGVVARTTNAGNFDPWDHSEFSRTSGAVSFSYLRADAKFGGAPWGNNEARHGYIFYPTLRVPQGKIRPSIICYFPYDGATIYRSKPGAHGCRDSITQFVYPLSKPCNEQNIFTARAWLTHFRRVSYGNPASCAWMLNDALNEQAVANFNAGLQVRKLVELEAGGADFNFKNHNELRIEAWPEKNPAALPIQAFFWITGSNDLETSRIDQKKYHERTNGLFIPIVRVTLPPSPQGHFSFQYVSADQAISPVIPMPAFAAPTIPKAYSTVSGDRLNTQDIYRDEYLIVQLPTEAIAASDILSVRWGGRVPYSSPPVAYGELPANKQVLIPRTEVVDSIGLTVPVSYTIKKSGAGETLESGVRFLTIDPQALVLPAPSYASGTVTVNSPDPSGSTLRVRVIGETFLDTAHQLVTAGKPNSFVLDPTWVSKHKGKTVLINYSVFTKLSPQWLFSQVLRVQL
ncbi:hypothetical protein [Pseudomonas sp. MPDS]|uniref:hypothetical protein n=1 Tax=Pseudomonas sp. MPDS TaxID=2762896 RepID=UPI00156582E3|nr:hypothetical protein [Pseudomonas sp. MPDS]QKJ34290.1 hypothetical protein HQ912_05330 [Pseudomonas sp. MPDS]